jgi:phospholipid-binding lipoprotein MlaA
MNSSRRGAILFFLGVTLCACSTSSPQSLAEHDPWEKTNRDIFTFDVWVEHNIAQPVNDAYRFVFPAPARKALHNAATNLHEPIVLANDVLQGDAGKAANTLGRIVVNSTIGIAGLIDVAGNIGLPYHSNDFGITLGKSGVQEGSYLVLPFIGPLPPRDLLGSGVDGFFDPLSWARFHGKDTWMFARSGLRVLDAVDQQRDSFETIERTSIDFYATTRNLYRQSRDARIRDENTADAQLPEF